MDLSKLRPIDYILLAAVTLIEIILYLQNKLLIGNTLLVITFIAVKLYNMYRLTPEEIRRRNRENGLAGLFC